MHVTSHLGPVLACCSEATLAYLAESCDEFLVHGVDVEGMQARASGAGAKRGLE